MPKTASGIFFHLRTKLAKLMARDTAELRDVSAVLDKLTAKAKLMGLPPGFASAVAGNKRTNSCNPCRMLRLPHVPKFPDPLSAKTDDSFTTNEKLYASRSAALASTPAGAGHPPCAPHHVQRTP